VAHLQGLPDGSYAVYGWKEGYLPASGTGTVTANAGSASLTLKPGQVATASLTSAPLTYDEIVAAGIDPSDPANQNVVEFSMSLAFSSGGTSTAVTGYAASGGFPLCPNIQGIPVTCGDSGISFSLQGYNVSVTPTYTHGQPQLVWLVVPAKASWLKEFFSVQMMVTNLADPTFTLDQGVATLPLPAGLSLAPTAVPQTASVSMPDIAGGSSKAATWLVRGDTEGFYDLASSYAGSLEPFGDTISITAKTQTPLHVWGGSALKLTVDAEDAAYEHYPYRATISLKNVADVPIYNATIEFLTDSKSNYIYEPEPQLTRSVAKLDPDDTLTHQAVVVPTISGNLDLSRSFVTMTAGTTAVPATITSHPAVDGYEVYSTKDPSTDFAAAALARIDGGDQTTATLDSSALAAGSWYAVRTLFSDHGEMIHPLTQTRAAVPITYGEQGGPPNQYQNVVAPCTARPVNCATGDFWHTFDDLAVPGRGVSLQLARTYDAAAAASDGPLGRGWTHSYRMSLSIADNGDVTVHQGNGSQVAFTATGSGFTAAPRVLASLAKKADGTYAMTSFHDGIVYIFSATGQLLSESDRNGYTTTLTYSGADLTKVTDPAGRSLSFTNDSSGRITKITDPAARSVSYAYDASGDLIAATDVAGGEWNFAYNSNHLMTSMTDPRGGVTANVYDEQDRVTKQTDPAGRITTFAYTGDPASAAGSATTMTDPNGNVTRETFKHFQLVTMTKAVGTAREANWSYAFDPVTLGLASITDPNGHTTRHTYDQHSNLLSTTASLERVTTVTYNDLDKPTTVTDTSGVVTTLTYDTTGNLTSQSRPLTNAGKSATVTYAHNDPQHPGDVTSVTDATGLATSLAYDRDGNLTKSVDAAGNTTTYGYDKIGRRTSMVSPRGNASSADPAKYTTTYTYNAFGDLTKTADPLDHKSTATFDANSNRISATDGKGNTTAYTYNADDELIAAKRADGTKLTYSYDKNGNQTAQLDGKGTATRYSYDELNRVVSATDGLSRTTTVAYDPAGNRTKLTDPSGKVTRFGYDAADQLIGISYSDGATPDVAYGYDALGQRTTMTDGTGKTTYKYDSLNRLTGTTDGAGAKVGYTYDLAGRVTEITYPNGKTVTRTYDTAGHPASVTDWLGNTTTLGLDADGNLIREAYPNGVTATGVFDAAGQLSSITDTKAGSTLASFAYTRDANGQVASSTPTRVPGTAESYSYTQLNQLGAVNTKPYAYDAGDNLTKLADGTTQSFDDASQLTQVTPPPVPPVSPTVDQVVSKDQKSPASTITSPTLGTGTGKELLLAFISTDGPKNKAQKVAAVTGGGLTWTRAAAPAAAYGTAEVWQAYSTGGFNAAVTAKLSAGAYDSSITVASFKGAASKVGATATKTGSSGPPAASLTTNTAGSLVWATGHNWDTATSVAPGSGQTLVHEFVDTRAKNTFWTQRTTNAVAAAGTEVSISDSRPATGHWQLSAVEIPADPAAAAAANAAPVITYAYDKQGNRTSATPGAGDAVTIAYDQANRMISHQRGKSPKATYTYDGDGLRTSKTIGITKTPFTWDHSGELPLLLADGADYYIYTPAGQPIEKITGSTPAYLHSDQQGSTRIITDGTGAVVGTYSYDPYGGVTGHTGTTATPLQYNGQYTDEETGYQYLRARYYEPLTAQFLTIDPLVQMTAKQYQYADGDPVNRADPTGLLTFTDCYSFGFGALHSTGSFGLCFNFGKDGYTVTGSAGAGLSTNGVPGFPWASVSNTYGLKSDSSDNDECSCDGNSAKIKGSAKYFTGSLSMGCDGSLSGGEVGLQLGTPGPAGSGSRPNFGLTETHSETIFSNSWEQWRRDWYDTIFHPTTILRGLGF
jgi:RHS repeat-associated protein